MVLGTEPASDGAVGNDRTGPWAALPGMHAGEEACGH